MLLRLGRWLRLLGQDVANPRKTSDDDLLDQAKGEKRTLLTRDKRLAETCQSQAIEFVLIRSSHLPEQLLEMVQRGILLELNPQRCTLCNCPLQEVESPERRTWICTGCKRAYWKGGHWKNMEKMLESIRLV
jgi:uncharacterized protein with PIN domain